jgi:chromosome segregation ATPase
MKQLLVPAFLILALSGVVVRDGSLQTRIDELAERPLANRRAVVQLEGQLEDLAGELAATRDALHAGRDLGSREVEDLDGRLRCLETRLGETGAEVASYNARLDEWETQWSDHGPTMIDERLKELRGTLEQRWV